MARLPAIGDKFGCLEVVDRGTVENDDDGYGLIYYAEFICECGNVFRVSSTKWAGKNKVKDCGCGIYANKGRRVLYSVNIRQDHREAIVKLATDNQVAESEAVRMIIEAGLIHLGYGE